GCPIKRSAASADSSKLVKAPSGNPLARKISAHAAEHCGTFAACLSTAVFPAASAGAANLITCQNGKFHGMIASTVPSGGNSTAEYVAFDSRASVASNAAALSANQPSAHAHFSSSAAASL